jgi:NlpC/P60 family
MSRRPGLIAAVGLFAIVSSCGTSVAVLGAGTRCGVPAGAVGSPSPHSGIPSIVRTAHGRWAGDQLVNASTIVRVGQILRVPPHGQTIAVATAMQESRLRNVAAGDRDSVGLFQQRPSQGWGTPEELHDPGYAAAAFYDRLLAIPRWKDLPLTRAAQAVQRSATPDAYGIWETDATTVVAAVDRQDGCPPACVARPWPSTPDLALAFTGCGDGNAAAYGLPDTYTVPDSTPPQVSTALAWAITQLGTPYHFGGDCTDPHSGVPAHQCDCSSLVQQAYNAAGVELPRTAAEQSRIGAPVAEPSQLRPGDLLFVPGADGTPTEPGHVGLYLGDQLVLDAPQEGAVVHVSEISGFWLTDLTIRRVVPARTP